MNDIDLWNLISELEQDGDTKEAFKLTLVYKALYIEHDKKEAERLIEKFEVGHLKMISMHLNRVEHLNYQMETHL